MVAHDESACLVTRAMPDLDPASVDALAEAVRPLVDSDDALRAWCTRANVERFLRADRGNLAKATKRLNETLRWRLEKRPETRMCSACLSSDLRSHYMQHVGWDRLGRALVYSDIGMARDKSADTNAEHCTQVLELLEPHLAPFPHDQYVWVVDFHKFGVKDMSPKVAGACLGLFGKCYPERLAGMILVGAPVLFNGLYRAVCAFADPVTVKKVRFARGPDGGGGGKAWDSVMDEFFDAEHKAWLETEMRENRASWRTRAKHKSWLAASIIGDGNRHGWQVARDAETGGFSKKKSALSKKRFDKEAGVLLDENHEPVCLSVPGHDIRGCASFLKHEACLATRRAALKHAEAGEATRGVVLAAAKRNGAEDVTGGFGHASGGVRDDAGDVFYDAEEHAFAWRVEA
jgi:hypothetical protein